MTTGVLSDQARHFLCEDKGNDWQRLVKACRGEATDRPPYFEMELTPGPVQYLLDLPSKPLGGTLHMDPEQHVELARRTGLDVIGLGFSHNPGREEQSLGTRAGLEEARKAKLDVATGEGIYEPYPALPPINRFAVLEELMQRTKGTGIGVFGYVHGVITPVYLGMGMETFWLNLMDDFELVEAAADYLLEGHVRIVERLCSMGIQMLVIGDDLAFKSGPIVPPNMMRRLFSPRIHQLVEPARKRGIPVLLHSDGNLSEVVAFILDAGVDGVHPVEPYCNDIYALSEQYRERLTLAGNMELQNVTPAQVFHDTKEHVRRLSASHRYIVSSSHSIIDDVPWQNYLAMLFALFGGTAPVDVKNEE